MPKRLIRASFLLLCICAVAMPARADVIFHDFGPGDAYNDSAGYSLLDLQQDNASIPTYSASVSSYKRAISLYSGYTPDEFTPALDTDNVGEPGTVIESTTVTGLMGIFGKLNPPVLVNSNARPLLTSGTQYWLIASAPTEVVFDLNSTEYSEMSGLRALSMDSNAWIVSTDMMAAFRITLALLSLGLLALIETIKRMRYSGRIPHYSRAPKSWPRCTELIESIRRKRR